MNYKAVLFDMNGVIVNDEPLHLVAFQNVLQARGHDLTPDQYKEFFAGKTDEDGFKQYFESMDETPDIGEVMQEKAQAYLDLAADQLEPYPGVVDFIKDLAARYPLALVTSSLRSEAMAVLDAFGIT